jgi:hypothetical protein
VHNRPPAKADSEVLSEPAAARLLSRASELDAARGAGAAVLELRAAALEAGISARAFDEALAELHGAEQARVPDVRAQPRRRRRLWALAVGVAALIAASSIAVNRALVPSGVAAQAAAPMIQEAFLLRCLSPGEAAELIRPLLDLRTNTVVYSAAQAPRVLTIRATPAQIRNVRSALDRYEGAGSPACARGPAPATR